MADDRLDKEQTEEEVLSPQSVKKGLCLAVLQILRQETNAQHPLHFADIQELLDRKYRMSADRKTLRLHLRLLTALGYRVEHCSAGWYYEHEFTPQELCTLISSLPDSLTPSQRSELVSKLKGLGGRYFEAEDEHRQAPGNSELLLNMEILQDAIPKGCCVSFCYGVYDVDKKLHLKSHHDGRPREYIVSPYRVVMSSGHFLLLCNTTPYEGITHYRLDRIRHMKLLESVPARPAQSLTDDLADISGYLSQRPYMYSDTPVNVRFRINRKNISDVLDWFGMDVILRQVNDTTAEVYARVSPTAVKFWALQFGERCEVTHPKTLRNELAAITDTLAKKYAAPPPRHERRSLRINTAPDARKE